jgi:hypothetical protein
MQRRLNSTWLCLSRLIALHIYSNHDDRGFARCGAHEACCSVFITKESSYAYRFYGRPRHHHAFSTEYMPNFGS